MSFGFCGLYLFQKSAMPLSTAQKLKIKEGDVLLTLQAPAGFKKNLGPLPAGVKIVSDGKIYSQLHWFVTNEAQVKKEARKVISMLKEGVICWAYFPKGSSGIQTDLTRDKGWSSLLAAGDSLAWLVLVSFDDTWSAFSFRLKTEPDKPKKTVTTERPILQYVDAAAKTVRLPDDLAEVLKKNRGAAGFFETLSFSNKKEYVEWIVTAKQEATRKTRVEGTLERLEKKWKNPRNL